MQQTYVYFFSLARQPRARLTASTTFTKKKDSQLVASPFFCRRRWYHSRMNSRRHRLHLALFAGAVMAFPKFFFCRRSTNFFGGYTRRR